MHGTHSVLWTGEACSFPAQYVQQSRDIRVTWEPEPALALAKLPGHFDSVVVDFGEVARALQVVEQVRNPAPNVPILVRTSAPDASERRALIRTGADCLLLLEPPAKAADQAELLEALAKLRTKASRLPSEASRTAETRDTFV